MSSFVRQLSDALEKSQGVITVLTFAIRWIFDRLFDISKDPWGVFDSLSERGEFTVIVGWIARDAIARLRKLDTDSLIGVKFLAADGERVELVKFLETRHESRQAREGLSTSFCNVQAETFSKVNGVQANFEGSTVWILSPGGRCGC